MQRSKANSLMDVTELGIVIDVRLVHPSKADIQMDVTVLGITVFLHPARNEFVAVSIIALQLSRES